MLLKREASQLLIIDMQEGFLPTIDDRQLTIERCVRLVKTARRLDVPITFSEHYPKGLGPTVQPLIAEAGEESVVLEKIYFSCLGDEAIRDRLHSLRKDGKGQVVVGGIEAHVCVAQTVMDLVDQGFEAYVAADAVSSRSTESRDVALDRLARHGAEIVDSEMVMFEWLEKAGTPEFKELQQLLK